MHRVLVRRKGPARSGAGAEPAIGALAHTKRDVEVHTEIGVGRGARLGGDGQNHACSRLGIRGMIPPAWTAVKRALRAEGSFESRAGGYRTEGWGDRSWTGDGPAGAMTRG